MKRGQPIWLVHWLERHQSPLSFWLHVVGIPLAVAGGLLGLYQLACWQWEVWYRPIAMIVGGYVLQWIGHVHEGNDMGEVILLKKWAGKPYCAVSPRYQKKLPATDG